MATIAADHHARRGERLLEAGDWAAAERAFADALWEAGGSPSPRLLAGRATALLRRPGDWEQKIDALLDANRFGCDSPQFWALSIRGFLHVLDRFDGRSAELSSSAERRLDEVRKCVADLIVQGPASFRRCIEAHDRNALGWAAALVAMGDWLYEFEGVEAGQFGRHPYRSIAETLYRPVASSDVGSLFDDPEDRAEIERTVTHRARRQMSKFSPATPRRSGSMELQPKHGWPLMAFRIQ